MEQSIIRAYEVWKAFPAAWQKGFSLRHDLLAQLRSQSVTRQVEVLRGVSFSIERGGGVAIVGRNGAGKSTLLRLLAGIMQPTSGSVEVAGRSTALLSLQPGFNRELSGLDNLRLGGAFLGIGPMQMSDLLPEIIAFSELGAAVDAPLKTYSSGMQARLGFSLALHALTEIVLVDEAIMVGDKAFQEKCILRIEAALAEGRTLVLVSHSEDIIRRLCQRALCLEGGQIVADGPVDSVLTHYHALLAQPE